MCGLLEFEGPGKQAGRAAPPEETPASLPWSEGPWPGSSHSLASGPTLPPVPPDSSEELTLWFSLSGCKEE